MVRLPGDLSFTDGYPFQIWTGRSLEATPMPCPQQRELTGLGCSLAGKLHFAGQAFVLAGPSRLPWPPPPPPRGPPATAEPSAAATPRRHAAQHDTQHLAD